jgi:nucleoside-diphosphate-sugar epimerase
MIQQKKETVLVTGSSGLIGSAVVNRLAERFAVVGFDQEGPPHPPPAAECVCVDLTSEESVKAGLERVRCGYGERIASVIHLAAYYDFSGEPNPLYDEITVRGTERLLRGLKEFQVEQFVFSSTMLVHAPCEPGQRINEDWPLEPKWAYPESKLKTEQLLRDERGDVPIVLLRMAGVYDDRCHSIPLAHQIQRVYERRLTSQLFPGDISRGQSFLHLDDLVDALSRVVERRGQLPPELTVLLGEPETLSYDELQRTFGSLIHGEEWETREIPKALAKTGAWLQDLIPGVEDPFIKPWMIDLADDHYALDITRARTMLGWEPKRSLRETLPKMIDALNADPVAWYRTNKLHPPSSLEATASHGERSTMVPASPRGPSRSDDQHREHARSEERTPEHHGMPGAHPDHLEMVREMRRPWLWTNAILISLGLWLMTSPFTFGYRSAGMTWSDLISGALLVLFGALSLSPRMDFLGRWSACLVGLWLEFAPLLFWAPDPAGYLNDTLIGALAIAFSVLVPMMPGMAHHMGMMMPGPEVPPGWSYNPSSWHQRVPLIALGLAGWLISRYLAAFQFGYIRTAWDPFFGESSMRVLHSSVSRMWPISDAGLGALAYTIEMLMACMGGTTRWRAMPWMVTFFGILVVPLGIVHILLVISMPVVVGYWCTLCLAAATVMLFMISLTVDEVVAMGQFLARSLREGKPFWRTFWVGGTLEGEVNEDTRTPRYGAPVAELAKASVWGVSLPWNLIASAALGLWLMFAPSVFGTSGGAADSDHVAGALVIMIAGIATAEVIRAGRLLNVLLGAWLIVAPWLLAGARPAAQWNDVVIGALLILLSLPLGTVRERYGSWDRFVVWPAVEPRAPSPQPRRRRAA